jgi:hypothetical protein
MTEHEYQKIIRLLTHPAIKEDCRATALKEFSLQAGVSAYNEIYKQVKAKNN